MERVARALGIDSKMSRTGLFHKGDVILTHPEEGFWGIAIVLSEREKTDESLPMCHIAITQLILQRPIRMADLEPHDLEPLEFARGYRTVPNGPVHIEERLVGVYTRRNKPGLKVLGKVDPSKCYSGPLPFSPDHRLKVRWPVYGDVSSRLGYEALVHWRRNR